MKRFFIAKLFFLYKIYTILSFYKPNIRDHSAGAYIFK